jgi:hypothetical protein
MIKAVIGVAMKAAIVGFGHVSLPSFQFAGKIKEEQLLDLIQKCLEARGSGKTLREFKGPLAGVSPRLTGVLCDGVFESVPENYE